MKVEKAQIRNFRILQELDVNFEDDLSVIIGKNNAGKTSFLAILEKFLSTPKPEFLLDDFSISAQKQICAFEDSSLNENDFSEVSLSLKLRISYEANDDISSASEFLLDLDVDNNYFVLMMEYVLTYEKYLKLCNDFKAYKESVAARKFRDYVSKNITKYFTLRIRAYEYGNDESFKEISLDSVHEVISMQTIGAKRDVDNEQGHSKSLSSLAYKYYGNIGSDIAFPELQKQLLETDENLTTVYKDIFAPVVDEIKEMSYNPQEAEISVISSLIERPIFKDNTVVKYLHNDTLLPEDYNGLGYLNLFAIMFDIRIKLDKLAKKNNPDERPTPINLLFIEEPEAHTHPQMQYVFIINIKRILKQQCDSTAGFSLQTVVSTHSAHIVSQCDFKDIKYFYRDSVEENSVKSRNLKDLYSTMVTATDDEKKAEQERAFRFVRQYVTLNRSELFFADKAILIEGDTERILLTAMMKKYDKSQQEVKDYVPLLSQNISVIEVGAYSHVFAIFLGFIGIKTLIFTDLDCAKKGDSNQNVKCPYAQATTSTNASIRYFSGIDDIPGIVSLTESQKTFKYDSVQRNWISDELGQLRIMFQTKENDYQPSSFEDAFLCCNLGFIVDKKSEFQGLKCRDDLTSDSTDYYVLASKCIDAKTTFALDILMNGGENNENWNMPSYIKEGFKWLAM